MVELSKLPASVKVQRMLNAFKQYKRRVFKPDPGVSPLCPVFCSETFHRVILCICADYSCCIMLCIEW